MNMRVLPFVILSALVIGCNKKHEICLSVEQPEYLCPGIAVQFGNCGPEDDSYTWDFGDGSGSSMVAPSHVFEEPDTFFVVVSAGTGRKKVKDSIEVKIALPTASTLTLKSMPSLAPDGQTWDPSGSAPDLRLWIFDEFGNTVFNSPQYNNITLPFTFDMQGTTLCKDCTWNLQIIDSQSGGDFDIVWDFTADYDTLAKRRTWDGLSSGGVEVGFSFDPR